MARSTVKIRAWVYNDSVEMSLQIFSEGRERYLGIFAREGGEAVWSTLTQDTQRMGDPQDVIEIKEIDWSEVDRRFRSRGLPGLLGLNGIDTTPGAAVNWHRLSPIFSNQAYRNSAGLVYALMKDTDLSWLGRLTNARRQAATGIVAGSRMGAQIGGYLVMIGAAYYDSTSAFQSMVRRLRPSVRANPSMLALMVVAAMFCGSPVAAILSALDIVLQGALFGSVVGGALGGLVSIPVWLFPDRETDNAVMNGDLGVGGNASEEEVTASFLQDPQRVLELMRAERDAEPVRLARENVPHRSVGNFLYWYLWDMEPGTRALRTLAEHENHQRPART